MCNLYRQTTAVEAMRKLFVDLENRAGNVEPGDIYPDRMAPIVTRGAEGAVLRLARWGLPSPAQYHSPSGIDRGVTNLRNMASPHWRPWLGTVHRCLVPVERFAEPRPGRGAGNAWYRLTVAAPAFFAGLWVPEWRSIRKLKEGETVDDLFGFLTCPPNEVVARVHPKAMPVILVDPAEMSLWLDAPWSDAKALQRPLPDELIEEIDEE
ncbi:SOS response-associated peptidase [Pararhodobacter aggregans]